jgi:hypothetical protein
VCPGNDTLRLKRHGDKFILRKTWQSLCVLIAIGNLSRRDPNINALHKIAIHRRDRTIKHPVHTAYSCATAALLNALFLLRLPKQQDRVNVLCLSLFSGLCGVPPHPVSRLSHRP